MLMRTKEIIDYSHVPERHAAIHDDLECWARWVVPHGSAWACQPMFRHYRSNAWQWERPESRKPIDTLLAHRMEKAVAALPEKHRDAIRWCYVFRGNPARMARILAVSKQGLADLVDSGRTMLINRTVQIPVAARQNM